jgi:SnoaL-like domain
VSVAEGKAAVRARFDAFNAADWTQFKELIAPQATIYFPGVPAPMTRDGWVGICLAMDPKPPAIQISIEEQIGEGDTVVTRWTIRGGPAALHGVSIDRVVNGQVVEHREYFEPVK